MPRALRSTISMLRPKDKGKNWEPTNRQLGQVDRLLSWWSIIPMKGNDSQRGLLILEETQHVFLSEPDTTINAHHRQTT